MSAVTPPSNSRRRRTGLLVESSSEESIRSSRRVVPRVQSYAESEGSDNINVGSSAPRDEVDSELSDGKAEGTVRCGCGQEEDDGERAFICCDRCGIWQHMECNGLDEDQDVKSMRWLCNECGPYAAVGAAMSPPQQTSSPPAAKGRPSKQKTLNVRSYYISSRDLSVKKPRNRVSFSSSAKPASSAEEEEEEEDDDDDGYEPSIEEISDGEDGDGYPGDLDEDDDRSLLNRTPTPANKASGKFTIAKTPRASGVTDLGEDIVRTWINGGYNAEIHNPTTEGDEGSDVSAIDIPDMSEGENLLVKLAEQDRLIFGMKARLERRGSRIGKLKREVRELRSENALLRGQHEMSMGGM